MKKDISIIVGLFVLIGILMIFGKGYTTASFLSTNQATGGAKQATPSSNASGSVKVTSGKLAIDADVAANLKTRAKGLGKQDYLEINRGMLFVFEQAGQYAIWMKDMKFAIDILWIDENKTIVDIAENVKPQPGKKDKELTIYKPSGTVKYILEMNAGLVKLNGLKLGDKVDFSL